MAKEALLSHAWMGFADDGIVRIRIFPNVNIDLEQIKAQHECIRHLAGAHAVAVMVDARADFTISREAQEYSAQQSHFRIATAIISNNSVTRVLTNTYVKIFRPVSPIKIFDCEEKATQWLLQMIGKKVQRAE